MAEANAIKAARPRLRPIALPTEHGGWSFIAEPVLLGLLVAVSWAGVFIGVAAFGVFLLHQPLKIALKDTRKGKTYPRTVWAWRFALGYAAVALIGTLLALLTTQHSFWPPLLLAAPFALIQLRYDVTNRGRELVPEICGALALLFVAPMIASAGGWPFANALALWGILAARTVTSIVYVRARLRLERGENPDRVLPFAAHLIGLAVVLVLAITGFAPWLTVAALVILLVRSTYGLSEYRRPAPAKVIGVQEIGYGLLVAVLTAVGYTL